MRVGYSNETGIIVDVVSDTRQNAIILQELSKRITTIKTIYQFKR
jgi:hypothetical protein